MFEKCGCGPGEAYCRRYGVAVTPRQHSYLRGDSGLPRSREAFYARELLGLDVDARPEGEPAAPAKPPGLVRKGVTFLGALAKHALNGFRSVSDADHAARLGVCSACEMCDKTGGEGWSCRECGCLLGAKARWESEDCPLGKWPKPLAVTGPGPGCGCGRG